MCCCVLLGSSGALRSYQNHRSLCGDKKYPSDGKWYRRWLTVCKVDEMARIKCLKLARSHDGGHFGLRPATQKPGCGIRLY